MDWTRQIRAYVEERRDEHLRELADYVAWPSVSATGQGFPQVADYVVELARRCGLGARAVPTSGNPVVLACAAGDPEAPHVLIYGHYDVQPPGPLEAWMSPPFTADVRAGRMFGRGVGDNKGQHLAHLLALRMLVELRGALPCRVTMVLDGEEEIGSPNLAEVVDRHRDELAADLIVVSDGPVHEDGRPVIKLGVRGLLGFELRVRGADYPLHSGNWGGVAPNPAWRLVWLLAGMRAPDGCIRIDGFDAGTRPRSDGEQAALSALPVDVSAVLAGIGAHELDVPAEIGYYERLTEPTLTINSLTCADNDEHRTVIPHLAVAKCDVRLTAGQRARSVAAAIAAHVHRAAPDAEFVVTGHPVEACRTPPESEYTEAITAAITTTLGTPPVVKPAMGGTLPLSVLVDRIGVPCYEVPFANPDEANHAPNENLELDRFHEAIRTSAAMLLELAARHRRQDAP